MRNPREICLALAASLAVIAGLMPAADGAATTTWQYAPATPGDWFAAANWTAGLPDASSSAYVQNGGTVQIGAGQAVAGTMFLGNGGGAGTLEQTGGSLTLGQSILLGTGAGSLGTYTLSGSGQVTTPYIYITDNSGRTGRFIQTGGVCNAGTVSFGSNGVGLASYDLSGTGQLNAGALRIGSSGATGFTQTGGTCQVSGELDVYSFYNLSGTGALTSKLAYVTAGLFTLSAGTHTVTDTLHLATSGARTGTYQVTGTGQLTAATVEMGAGGAGVFQQAGGASTVYYMYDQYARGTLDVADGTLTITGNLTMTGKLQFSGNTGLLQIADGALADLSTATFLTPANGAITAAQNTLVILPAGFDTATLRQYSSGGITHVLGSGNVVIPTGAHLPIFGQIADHVVCDGAIDTPAGRSLTLNGGLEVHAGGAVNLGSYGKLYVNEASSGMTGGALSASELWVGATAAGTFTQDGGAVSVAKTYLGYNWTYPGTYVLRGDGTLTTNIEWVGNGSFVQEGGTHNATTFYIDGGASQLGGGTLNVSSHLWIGGNYSSGSASMTQTGGTINDADSFRLGGNGAVGTYLLQGGAANLAEVDVYKNSLFRQSGGAATARFLNLRYGGRFEYAGGSLALGGWVIDSASALDFTGQAATIQAADGSVLDFRQIAAGSVKNAQNISFVAGANTLTLVAPGFDPSSVFAFSTTGLLHTVGTPLTIPAGMNLKFSHINVNSTVDFTDHLTCYGSFGVGGSNQYTGLNLTDGIEIGQGATVNIGFGTAAVNDVVSRIASGQLSAANGGGLLVGKTKAAAFTQTGGKVAVSDVWVGSRGLTATSSYSMQAGNVAAGTMYVGYFSPATFLQATGAVSVDATLNVGYYTETMSPTTTYEMRAGSTLTTGCTFIGNVGRGLFTQNGGTHTTAQLTIGAGTDFARYVLNSGQLNVGQEFVDNDFYQSGGANTVTGTLDVENYFSLSGGNLQAANVTTAGHVSQTNGVFRVIQDLAVSSQPNGGIHDLSGGTLSAGTITVWQGSFNQRGGRATVDSLLTVGFGGQTQGAYTLQSGDLVAHDVDLGATNSPYASGMKGTFTQSGGTNTVAGTVCLGRAPGATGVYNLSTGPLSCGNLWVGDAGTGTFTQTGGTVTIAQDLVLANAAGSSGAYSLQGGTLNVGGNIVRGQGAASFVLGGGKLNVSGTSAIVFDALTLGDKAGQYSNFELGGGTLVAENLVVGNYGTGLYRQTGGTQTVNHSLQIGAWSGSYGSYTLSLGHLVTAECIVGAGGTGILGIQNATADLVISERLKFGSHSILHVVPGASVRFTGSAFENTSTDAQALAELEKLVVKFEGGPTLIDPLEVAGKDLGPLPTGFSLNFALGDLVIGNDSGAVANVQLVDLFDNQPVWTGKESLYVHDLWVGPGSQLDLNGIKVYCDSYSLDPQATLLLNGGSLAYAPEPATLGLLALGLALAAAKARRMRARSLRTGRRSPNRRT